jgi:hypothetical protein
MQHRIGTGGSCTYLFLAGHPISPSFSEVARSETVPGSNEHDFPHRAGMLA